MLIYALAIPLELVGVAAYVAAVGVAGGVDVTIEDSRRLF
jgi:hypothetical protein